MQEEISLREIIETIWNGKWIIAVVTIGAMILSGIISAFLLSPTYEAVSTVRIQVSGEQSQQYLNSLAESLKSDVAINRIINKLKLDKNLYTIDSIRNSVQVSVIKDTNVIKLTVKGNDPSAITSITNLMAFELGARVEIADRSQQIIDSRKRLLEIEDTIKVTTKNQEETMKQLEKTPEKLVTKEALTDKPFLESVLKDSTSANSRDLGAIQMESESINPVYTTLKARYAETTINLAMQLEEKQNLENNISKNESQITELEQQIKTEKLKTMNSERLLSGFNAVFISPAIEPVEPVGPKTLLNIAIAAVVGAMVSTLFVFMRQYWRNTAVTS